jgi:Na+/proline symporter
MFNMLSTIDGVIIVLFFVISLVIGLLSARRAGKDSKSFFLSGQNMPWWLLGVSMVATTFSADTPNLVTDIVRQHGVAGNWVWWAFLLTGMLTVFVFAALWRRSGILTDLEFYELRYSGKAAAFLRGFRAIYLGVFFNILIMATVSLAAIKIGSVLLGVSPWVTLTVASVVTVIYSSLGGLRGVLITDFFQFFLAIIGTVLAAWFILGTPEIGGLDALLSHKLVADKIAIFPDFSDPEIYVPLFLIPLAVQWWSVWYPGSEPGGGGYIAQRMLAAKDEKHAVGATFLFNAAHYALRPWPWILIALASLVIYPDLVSLQSAFPDVNPELIRHDMAYPAMIRMLPSGLLGLVIASLIAAYMSTISTHLNWGSSYVVHDFYKRFICPEASEKKLVLVGRLTTIGLMLLSAVFTLALSNALQAFQILLQVGAGTGLIFILRWFWWRVNPWSEVAAMVSSFLIAIIFQFVLPGRFPSHWEMVIGVVLTTVIWLVVTWFSEPSDDRTLTAFYRLIRPTGPGWKPIAALAGVQIKRAGSLPGGILMMFLGTCSVYSTLFATGYWIYGETGLAVFNTATALVSGGFLFRHAAAQRGNRRGKSGKVT